MNFQDLLTKIRSLDESQPIVPPVDDGDVENIPDTEFAECGDGETNPKAVLPGGDDEMLTGECGGMMPSMSAPKQSDSVTMNVSMNGSGAGGIKDLLDIIRNIQDNGSQDSDDVLVGIGAEEGFDDATTRPNPQTSDVNAVIQPPSDDIHSKGARGKKSVSISGSNPMEESLVAKLTARYNEIKGA